ncbi:MAG: hypothetical protein ACYDHA_13570, partial [Bellilinea sp.]
LTIRAIRGTSRVPYAGNILKEINVVLLEHLIKSKTYYSLSACISIAQRFDFQKNRVIECKLQPSTQLLLVNANN